MFHLALCILSIFLFRLHESKPQHDGRILFSGGNSGYSSQHHKQRQGTIDEFLAIRTTTERLSPQHEPCYPQMYPIRNKRSPHFKRKRVITAYPYPYPYPVYVNYQNANNILPTKPPYSPYGGYYCGNSQSYTKPPVHNSLLSHLFGNIFDVSSQQGTSSVGNNDIRPVYENVEYDNDKDGVIIILNMIRILF